VTDGGKKDRGWFGFAGRHRAPSLGERELAVLEMLWNQGPASAQRVQRAMSGRRVTLSTVQSTLERLTRKGLLSRRKEGRSYCYTPVVRRSELITRLLRELAADVAGGDPAPMLAGFVDYLADADPELKREFSRTFDAPPEEPDDG
jgi:predicted transcriptional regulator